MEQYKQEFIDFMVESQVLKFGDFTLKSGRKSPFFMNAGGYVTGSQLKKLGEYYAKAIHNKYGDDFDVLFGPAYKGIPLAVVTAMAYSELYGKEIRYCSDRKEEKDHGADKGSFLGSKLQDGDRVVMIEDVTTSAIRNYNEWCEPVGIPKSVYLEFWRFDNSTENDVDKTTGKKIAYSAVKKIMAYINSLNLTDQQKDALAKSAGWADKTIKKYKLW